ncbi:MULTISPECIES: glycoside hydrolase family 20 protein [unclassified Carboxylicivirga]|uniref:glycoside hydrolase family 20 protein n=1 Tax=Carboxylicivirga TaxID=1628153 RepID=UPI003D32E3CD
MTFRLITGFLMLVSLLCHNIGWAQNASKLIPLPQTFQQSEGHFAINKSTKVILKGDAAGMSGTADHLRTFFSLSAEQFLSAEASVPAANVFVLELNPSLLAAGKEAYELTVSSELVSLSAGDAAGLFYGVQTLRQLSTNANQIAACHIKDAPRMHWRGFMLDCSRHFWTIDELKVVVDQMALIKLNRLHLHLTDDQGWRLEIKKYPALTEKGTHYKDFPALSGNYYTQEQMRELIAYAADRQVMIVPEIDLPGHSRAVLAAYPELSCKGGEFEVYPMEQPANQKERGYEVMLCAGKKETYQFMRDVVKEVAALFPSPYIHLGGDEVGKDIWKECSHCQAMMKKKGLKSEEALQDYFTREASKAIRKRDKRMIGWDEINERGAATGDDVVMVWRDHGTPQAMEALEAGLSVVMCPQHGCYFDWGYSGNSTKKVYSWEPVPAEATPQQQSLVMGAQACLWTELVTTTETIEERIFPRILALAEVVWLDPQKKNWDDFLQRLTNFYPLMDEMGINYFDEKEIDAVEFKPGEQEPLFVRNARVETTLGIFSPYVPEYVFDGRLNSYFWTNRPPRKGETMTLTLGETMKANHIKVITGDGKDIVEHGILELSSDGKNFTQVATFNEGMAVVELDDEQVKAVRLVITQDHKGWAIIKEFVIE